MRELELLRNLREKLPVLLKEGKVKFDVWIPLSERRGTRGLEAPPDAEAKFSIAGQRLHLVFEATVRPNMAILRDKVDLARLRARVRKAVPMIAAPYLTDDMRLLCEQAGVGYVDLSGNVRLVSGSVVIRKEAPRNLHPHEAKDRSPFADKASLVWRYLIDKTEPQGVRAIAGAIASKGMPLDPGYVSRILRTAQERGYAALDKAGRGRLRNQEELLADWSAAYDWRRNDARGYFWLGSSDREITGPLSRLVPGKGPARYALTLHAGNNAVEPYVNGYNVLHLYAALDSTIEETIRDGLNLRPVDVEAANVVILRPYYRDSVFFGARKLGRLWVVSDLQLYLDLRRFPIRGVEAADRILDRRLRKLWSRA